MRSLAALSHAMLLELQMASPKEWSIRDGDKVEVDTPFTNRARELVELYSGLCEPASDAVASPNSFVGCALQA